MSWAKDWRKAFENLKKDESYDGNVFGINCWYYDDDVIKHLTELESLGATIELNIEYWESVRVYLPQPMGRCIQVLLYILTSSAPTPTEVIYHEKRPSGKKNLEITWS